MFHPDNKKIVYVDGFKIRQLLDADFPMMDYFNDDPTYFDPKYYIPENELWIDYVFRDETEFLIELDKINHNFGLEQRNKAATGNKVDQQRAHLHSLLKINSLPNFIITHQLQDNLVINYVDGQIVRQYFDPEFMFGGHDFVYSYIPNNQIWIDNKMNDLDKPHVLVHEMEERSQMEIYKFNYDQAHEYATTMEKRSRRKAGATYPEETNYPKNFTRETLIKIFKDIPSTTV